MQYLSNKYAQWYYQIINHAVSRPIINGIYYETHHIIPKSLGGSDELSNLVSLTAKEHFVCHHLLVKMTENDNKRKMSFAFWCFCILKNKHQERIRVTARQYETAKNLKKASTRGGWTLSKETKEKMSKAKKGKPSEKKGIPTGRKVNFTDEVREKISQSKLGKKRKPFSKETKEKMSKSGKGRVFSDEHRKKISEANKKYALNKKLRNQNQNK